MDITTTTVFFKNLTLVVGAIYAFSGLAFVFAQDLLISTQKKFLNVDDDLIKKLIWGYLAIFKIMFIILLKFILTNTNNI